MSFRTRVFLACLAAVVIPVAVVGVGLRMEIEERLRAGYEERVDALAGVIEEDLEREAAAVGDRLSTLAEAISSDNRFRAAVAGGAGDRGYLLDYAGESMRLAGLSMLQIQGPDGRIVSSGHFRNAFDVLAPELPRRLASLSGGTALTRARTAEGEFLALVRVDSVRLGGRRYHLVGGTRVEEAFLSRLTRDPELSVRLLHPEGVSKSGAGPVVRTVDVPYVEAGGASSGGAAGAASRSRFEISYDDATLRSLRRSADVWFAMVLAGGIGLSLLVATWLSGRVTKPLEALAAKTARVDLDRLDVEFRTGRSDEIGQLSRLLHQMTERLRASAHELRDAERRATLGEVARQVNHDVRNGLVPIRNVLRHLDEVAREAPGSLAAVFDERRRSLASSVAYLETLAGNYARLSSRAGTGSADPRDVVATVVEGASAGSGVPVRAEADPSLPRVRGDAVTVRRIVENLVTNATAAAASTEGGPAVVTVRATGNGTSVRIVVEDTGRGMTEEERKRAFEDFFTTKEDGTGLGLSVVRRLVRDLEGSVELESEVGKGTRVTVVLPAVAAGETAGAASARTGRRET